MRIEVIRAWPRRFESCTLELAPGSTVTQAIEAAGWANDPELDALAVHGVRIEADTLLRDGDRIELLRALVTDPKESRRRRADAKRAG